MCAVYCSTLQAETASAYPNCTWAWKETRSRKARLKKFGQSRSSLKMRESDPAKVGLTPFLSTSLSSFKSRRDRELHSTFHRSDTALHCADLSSLSFPVRKCEKPFDIYYPAGLHTYTQDTTHADWLPITGERSGERSAFVA